MVALPRTGVSLGGAITTIVGVVNVLGLRFQLTLKIAMVTSNMTITARLTIHTGQAFRRDEGRWAEADGGSGGRGESWPGLGGVGC